jgi:CheY-like chemotaxis protein
LQRLGHAVVSIVSSGGAMDGIQTAAAMTARRLVPIIFLSTFVDRETLARAGAVTDSCFYIVKPLDNAALRETLGRAVGHP